MARPKKHGGFTLLEVVISVAALALISVFVVQMFMASSGVNRRARDADTALATAVTLIEHIKSRANLLEFVQTEPGLRTDPAADFAADEHERLLGYEGYVYYDKDWGRINTDENASVRFRVWVGVTETVRGLYDIDVRVSEWSDGAEARELATLQAKKYFPL